MVTKLSTVLKREVEIVVTFTNDALKIVPKGRRKGVELAWRDLVSGEAALAVALNASLGAVPAEARPVRRPSRPPRRPSGRAPSARTR